MGLLLEVSEIIETIESVVYIGSFPSESVDNICTVYSILGRSADQTLDGMSIRNPSIRVLVRDKSYARAEERLEAIIQKLATSTSSSILAIFQESEGIDLGKDKKDRTELYCNFRVKYI